MLDCWNAFEKCNHFASNSVTHSSNQILVVEKEKKLRNFSKQKKNSAIFLSYQHNPIITLFLLCDNFEISCNNNLAHTQNIMKALKNEMEIFQI